MSNDPLRIILSHKDQNGTPRKRVLDPRNDNDRDAILRTVLWCGYHGKTITIQPYTVANATESLESEAAS